LSHPNTGFFVYNLYLNSAAKIVARQQLLHWFHMCGMVIITSVWINGLYWSSTIKNKCLLWILC